MSQHLTLDEKVHHLAEWAEKRTTMPHTTVETGGHGLPDAEVFTLTDALNALPGVCTVQSCAGHRLRSVIDGEEYRQPAGVWLRLGPEAFACFMEQAPLLARTPGIEAVRVLFSTGHIGPVVEVDFRGNDCDTADLERSAATIVSFFAREVAG
jgi:hypothetical protein